MSVNAEKKKEIIERAHELGKEYELEYIGCAQTTFAAIVDTLKEYGINIVSDEATEQEMFTGLIGLTAGVGRTNEGSCGAVTGSGFAVSLALGIGREDQKDDVDARLESYKVVRESIANRFFEKYGSLLCKDIQLAVHGKAWKQAIPEIGREFVELHVDKCEPLKRGDCPIANGAAWAVEAIIDRTPYGEKL